MKNPGILIRAILISLIIVLASHAGQCQSPVETDMFKDANGNTYHQMFLDFQADRLLDLHINNDEEKLEGELTEDGYSILIKNYPGNKSVKARVLDMDGNEKEVIKSKCFIDPVLMPLL